MGKPAARVIVDQAAHTGPITMGSFNVIIGGKPAARKGDPITCSAHGQASIIEGSTSVLINGIPVARMGDKTSCGTPPMPPPAGPKAAEDDVTYWSPAKDSNPKDGTVPTQYPDNIVAKPLYAYAGYKDRTKDGSYDQVTAGFSLIDFQGKGDWNFLGEDKGGLGGSAGFSLAKVDITAGIYGSNGVYGRSLEAKATAISAQAEGHIGKEGTDLYAQGKGTVDFYTAEAKIIEEVYTGGSEKRIGFNIEKGAEAAVMKQEGEVTLEDTFTKVKIKAAALEGAVGAAAGLGGYVDYDDYLINLKISGELAVALGLKADIDVTLKFKPFVDGIISIMELINPSIIEGTILTGCPTVIIG